MLLRASGEHAGVEHELASITTGELSDTTVADAQVLVPFAEAIVSGDVATLWATRERVALEHGPDTVSEVAATAAIFNAVVKIADATGIPIEDYKVDLTSEVRAELGVDAFWEARNGE